MPNQRKLEARLASLQQAPLPSAGGRSHPGGAGGLKERLEALSGVNGTSEGREDQFNSRLEALQTEGRAAAGGGGLSNAEDLAARFERLGGGVGGGDGAGAASTGASAATAPENQQQYRVPEVSGGDVWTEEAIHRVGLFACVGPLNLAAPASL